MRGKAEISYTDSRGNVFDLMSDGLRRIHTASFHEYSWDKDVTSKRFGEKLRAFKKGALSLSTTIYFDGPNKEKHLNEFHSATEYDIINDQPGTLQWEDYSISCYMVSSKTHPAEEKIGAPAANEVVFYCPDPFWTKLQSYSSYTANDRPVKAARIAANKNPIKELTGELVHFDDAKEDSYLPKTILTVEPKQDLHGYDHPWVGGAGKNLFDKNAKDTSNGYYAGRWVRGASVVESTDANYSISEYIPLKTNTQYTVSGTYGTNPGVAFYDSSKQYVSGYSYGVGSDNPKFTFTTPGDIVYGRFSIVNALVDKMQLELGSTATAYEPYENICTIEPYDEIELYHNDSYSEHNIWDEDVELGGFVWATGAPFNATDRLRSKNFQKCDPNTTYYVRTNNNNVALFFYDGFKKFISYVSPSRSGGTVTSPNNAHYFKVHIADATVYTNDICINIPDPTFDGQYEPYHNSYPKLDTEPYLVRPASQLGGKAYDKLVGMSVVWNQWSRPGDDHTIYGVSMVKNADGSVTFNGTATSSGSLGSNASFPVIAGHKYLFTGNDSWFENGHHLYTSIGGSSSIPQPTIKNATVSSGSGVFCARSQSNGEVFNNEKLYAYCVDLTLAFGPTIADYMYSIEQRTTGSGISLFKKMFPVLSQKYNPGELISIAPTAKEVTGKNLVSCGFKNEDFNGIKSSNNCVTDGFIFIKGGEEYTLTAIATAGLYFRYFDRDKNWLRDYNKTYYDYRPVHTFTAPQEASYIRIMFYDVDGVSAKELSEVVQLELGATATSYEPYNKTRYPLPGTELNGVPNMANGQITSDGDTLENDCTLTRKYGLVDLGTLTWTYYPSDAAFYCVINKMYREGGNLICSRYAKSKGGVSALNNMEFSYQSGGTKTLWFKNTSYTDANAFKEAVSGIKLVYELATPVIGEVYEETTLTGPIVSFKEESDTIVKPIVKIAVKQSGTGTPSPSNDMPITGWDKVDITVSGENLLFDYTAISWAYGMTGTKINGGVRLTGTPTWSSGTNITFRIANIVEFYKSKLNGTAQFKVFCDSSVCRVTRSVVSNDKTLVVWCDTTATTKPQTIDFYIMAYINAEPIEFAPYVGNTTTVQLGQAMCSGELNPSTGVLNITHAFSQRTYVDVVTTTGPRPYWRFSLSPIGINSGSDSTIVKCNIATTSIDNSDNTCYVTAGGGLFILFHEDQTLNTKPLADAWLSNHPVQICYKLATPQIIQLSPTEVKALIGENYIWSDAGDITVTYMPYKKPATPFISPQKVYPLGLERYIDERDIPVPVGHETRYYDGVMHQFKSSQFGGDVYGLTIDLVNGVVKKTHKTVSSSDLYFGMYDARTYRIGITLPNSYPEHAATPVADIANMRCTLLKTTSKNGCTIGFGNISHSDVTNTRGFIARVSEDINSISAAQTWASKHPFDIVYELATPETYKLSPRQLKALTGDNYVFGSDGVVTLAYISDFDPHMLLNADGTPLTPQEGLVYVIQEGAYKGHEFIWNGEEYLDLTSAIIKAYEPAHPYAYDYKADFESYLSLTNDNELGSKYVAIIYGPCTNPDIILANDGEEDDVEIAINTDVPAGGRLVVDSTDKTVTKYMPDGSTLNCFGQIDKEAGYLWTKVPYGLSHVIWDGSFDFDLLLIEERSEPKWLLG